MLQMNTFAYTFQMPKVTPQGCSRTSTYIQTWQFVNAKMLTNTTAIRINLKTGVLDCNVKLITPLNATKNFEFIGLRPQLFHEDRGGKKNSCHYGNPSTIWIPQDIVWSCFFLSRFMFKFSKFSQPSIALGRLPTSSGAKSKFIESRLKSE